MKNRHYLYIKAFSDFGSNMDTLVLNIMILSLTHSPWWLSVNLGLRTLGGALSSLYAGNLADRWDRKKMMLLSDIFRMVAVLFVIVWPSHWSILSVSFAIGIMSSFFAVGFGAVTPQLFGEENLIDTNTLIARLQSVSAVSGFAGAGVIGMLGGSAAALGIDAFSYLVSAIALFRMSSQRPSQVPSQVQDVSKSVVRDLQVILKYAVSHRAFLLVISVFFLDMVGASVLNVSAPLMAEHLDSVHPTLVYGVVWGGVAFGTVIASPFISKWKFVSRDLHLGYWVGLILSGGCYVGFLVSGSFILSVLLAILAGIFETAIWVCLPTIFQQAPDSILGRIFGFTTLLRSFGFALGYVLTPFVVHLLGYQSAVLALQGVVMTGTLIAIVIYLGTKVRHLSPSSEHMCSEVPITGETLS